MNSVPALKLAGSHLRFAILRRLRHVTVPAGEVVCAVGDAVPGVYYVLEGTLERVGQGARAAARAGGGGGGGGVAGATTRPRFADGRVFWVIGPGGSFGEEAFLKRARLNHSVVASTPATLSLLPTAVGASPPTHTRTPQACVTVATSGAARAEYRGGCA